MILLQLFHWKAMAFKGGDPIRTKIVIDNKIIEQVNSFNYLRNMISYEKELDIENKLHTRVGTLIVATIYLQLIQNRYMFRSFTVLQCSHQHCVQPVASDVEVVGYL